jgi:hypothetical protein
MEGLESAAIKEYTVSYNVNFMKLLDRIYNRLMKQA